MNHSSSDELAAIEAMLSLKGVPMPEDLPAALAAAVPRLRVWLPTPPSAHNQQPSAEILTRLYRPDVVDPSLLFPPGVSSRGRASVPGSSRRRRRRASDASSSPSPKRRCRSSADLAEIAAEALSLLAEEASAAAASPAAPEQQQQSAAPPRVVGDDRSHLPVLPGL